MVDSYIYGTSGYRVWSDGYCEQWGLSRRRTANENQTINFLKAFSDTNYSIVISNVTENHEQESGAVTSKATNYITVFAWNNRRTSWYACGYIK